MLPVRVTMDAINWNLVLSLLTAHILADFLLQTDEDVERKFKPVVLLKHAGIIALLSYLFVGRLGQWAVPIVIFVSHALIDLVKVQSQKKTLASLIVDQLAHVLIIFLLGVLYSQEMLSGSFSWISFFEPWYYHGLILISGFVLTIHGGAVVIRIAMRPHVQQMEYIDQENRDDEVGTVSGLIHGGKTIGQLERALIFLFILVGEPAGLGFLVAAKSIFRFGELKDTAQRMQAEYIMIGTLWSFAYGIAVSYGTYQLFLRVGF